MLLLLVIWVTTTIGLFLNSQHFPLHHSISWEFSNTCCPQQGIFPSSTIQTTDLLVGLVSQPLASTYWMSVVHEHRSLCRHAMDAIYISSYALCGVSLLTLTAISVERLLALCWE